MTENGPKMSPGVREAWSVVLLAVCALLFLSLVSYDWRDIGILHAPPNQPLANLIGPVGAWLSFACFQMMGVGAYLVPLWFLGFGVVLIFHGIEHVRAKLAWAALMMVSLTCLLNLHEAWFAPFTAALNLGAAGGVPAKVVAHVLAVDLLGDLGANILMLALLLASSILFFGWDAIVRQARRLAGFVQATADKFPRGAEPETAEEWPKRKPAIKEWKRERIERIAAREESDKGDKVPRQGELIVVPEPEPVKPVAKPKGREKPEPVAEPVKPAVVEPEPDVEPPPPPPPPPKPVPPPKPAPKPEAVPVAATTPGTYQLPPISLLTPPPATRQTVARSDAEVIGRSIVETLEQFGIKTQLRGVESGPAVARYELVPAPGVKVERIAALSNNLALSLSATSVRVQAPIPGKGSVGIEVPHAATSAVYLREILEGSAWHPERMEIPIVLGKDVGGNDLVADLATMPHMLVAGATGSGKTVCMNSILAGLLMSRTPEQLQLMLIDPKIVEFSVYNRLPHLLGARNEVITDPKKVAGGLRWAITEMERRYQVMAKAGVRNIKSFNARPVAKQQRLFGEGEEASRIPDRMSYIVIIVDELADLMMTAQAEIENYIARLAQLSRAVGIHMILATQRPSVDVITGTIKANFPARIAFQVAQKNDSRTILDANGADKLLGRGDMLFLPPGASKLIRAQGTLTSDDDIRNVVEFIRKQCPPPPAEAAPSGAENGARRGDASRPAAVPAPAPAPAASVPGAVAPSFDDMLEKGGGEDDDDQLIEMAVQIIRETQRASTSSLQRRLRIGYTRAARIMDVLEQRGIVGPARGSDPREILVDLEGEVPNNPAAKEDEES